MAAGTHGLVWVATTGRHDLYDSASIERRRGADVTAGGEGRATLEREDWAVRRQLIVAAGVVTVLAVLHHTDHVIRGDLVLANGLPETWNHSGWPFQERVNERNPYFFTASLGIYLLLVPGIVLTVLRRVGASYWIATAIVIGAIVVLVHFAPPRLETEYPSIIYATYGGGVGGVLALIDMFALVGAVAVLGVLAVRGRRRLKAR